ncbi:TPA: hypothetical protein DCX15_01335, partial [bacterium]|nr:hypothetical protein [bacterium]
DEIPPGFLVIEKIEEESYRRLQADLRAQRGLTKDFSVQVLRNVGRADWINVKGSPKEMMLAELRDAQERIIFRNFGVTPAEMGFADRMPRATAEAQEWVGRSKLYLPLLELLASAINSELVSELDPAQEVWFEFRPPQRERDLLSEARAKQLFILSGVLSPNEVREQLGLPPREGGDEYMERPTGAQFPVEESAKVYKAVEGKETEEERRKIIERIDTDLDVLSIEKLKTRYGKAMLKVWKEGLKRTLEEARKGVIEKGKVEIIKLVGEENPVLRAQRVEKILSYLFNRFRDLEKDYYPQAFEIGRRSVRRIRKEIGKGLTKEQTEDILKDLYRKNEDYLRNSLLADLRNDLNLLFTRTFEDEAEYRDEVKRAFDNKDARVGMYAGALWGVSNTAFAKEGFELGARDFNWTLNSPEPCPDCIELAKGSPYQLETLTVYPGDGTTRCNGYCHCNLELKGWLVGE